MDQVFSLLNNIYPITHQLRQYLEKNLKPLKPNKDTHLVHIGDIADTIGFIEKGLIRGCWLKENKEITSWFMKEGDVFISVTSFLRQVKSLEAVVTVEPCIIYTLTHSQYKQTFKIDPTFQLHRAELLEKYYLQSIDREDMLRLDVEERIGQLLKNY